MMRPAGVTLRKYIRSFFRAEERLTPSEWNEKHIVLPAGKQETEHGNVKFSSRPYLREPIDSFADPTVTDIVFVGPTRIGKTFFLRMVFAWSVAGDPAPMLWVDSTEDKGQDISKKELQPMVEANACLRDRKPTNRHNFTDQRMLFPGAAFTIVGGNSVAQVSGDTVKRVLGNELDKWSDATDKEASIAELVRHRTESFDDERKHGWSSTPTLEEGQTWQYYLRGDQRKWFCVCPRCSTPQQLIWGERAGGPGVWWDPAAKLPTGKWDLAAVKRTARYRCANVACPAHSGPDGWTDDERRAAIQHPGAHWRATAIAQPAWRSYHVNGLYGPLNTNNVGALAVDYLSSKTTGFYADRQDFWNSRMGLPWVDSVTVITAEKFAARERLPATIGSGQGVYLRGTLPEGWRPDVVITSFDVQSNRLPYVVRAYDWAGNSFVVDHGEVPTWKDLEAIQEDYRPLGGTSYVIGDINYEDRRAETLEQIYLRKDRGWLGAEAFEFAKDRVRLEDANVYLGGKLQKAGHTIKKLVLSSYEFKVELEKRFCGEIPNWFCYSLPLAASEQEVEEQAEYYTQLLDERRRPRKNKIAGKPPLEFHSKNKNNHAFDCEVYALALFWVLQTQRSAAAKKPAPPAERRSMAVSR